MVDFLRESCDKRITLVLHQSAQPVRSLWALMTLASLDEAKKRLADREGISKDNVSTFIGSWSRNEPNPKCILEIGSWAAARGIQHVVWTALPPKFDNLQNQCPSLDDVITHLSALTGPERDNAENYIRRTPPQIDTTYRRGIEARLHWSFRAVGANKT